MSALPRTRAPQLRDIWAGLVAGGGPPPFVILDAAGLERGREQISRSVFPELECLFSGDLATELADVAPYLGRLASLDENMESALGALLAKDVAIVVIPSDPNMELVQLHRHLRKFNVVYGPDGNPLFFRYYDPRVLPGVLEVFDPEQREAFFGPIDLFVLQKDSTELIRLDRQASATAAPS
jgi:hypothetical protein